MFFTPPRTEEDSLMTRIICALLLLSSLLSPAGVQAWSDAEESLTSPLPDWRCIIVTAASDEQQSEDPAEDENEEPDCE